MAVSAKAAAAATGSSKQKQNFGKTAGKARKEQPKFPANKPGRSGKARSNKASPFEKKKS